MHNFSNSSLQIRRCPAKSSAAIQGSLMCTFNKTMVWFDSLDEEIAKTVVDQAKRRAPEIRRKFRQREEEIRNLRLERIREKEQKVKEKEAKALMERFKLIDKVDAAGGLWKTEAEMKEGLLRVKEAARGEGKGKQIEQIKSQMSYRRKILEQTVADPKDWHFSENGRALGLESLTIKLAKLIGQTAAQVVA